MGYHGILLIIEKIISDYIKVPQNFLVDFFKAMIVFSFVTFGWLLFKLPEFEHVIKYLIALSENFSTSHNKGVILMIAFYSFPVFIYYMNFLIKQKTGKNYMDNSFVYAVLLFLIIVNSGSSSEFIYFQF